MKVAEFELKIGDETFWSVGFEDILLKFEMV